MKYREGGDIELGHWVKRKAHHELGRIVDMDPKCGMLTVDWEVHVGPGMYKYIGTVRPKHIVKAEPEDLI